MPAYYNETLRTASNARVDHLQTMLADIWRRRMYDPLKVEKTDHPDIVGGIVWADCELDWIRTYGTRCFNHGNAKGLEAGKLLFEEPKVGAGGTAVTREMITAAHGVTLESGDVVLSARLLERIYTAMSAAAKTHNAGVKR
jgi:hypothetical protein